MKLLIGIIFAGDEHHEYRRQADIEWEPHFVRNLSSEAQQQLTSIFKTKPQVADAIKAWIIQEGHVIEVC